MKKTENPQQSNPAGDFYAFLYEGIKTDVKSCVRNLKNNLIKEEAEILPKLLICGVYNCTIYAPCH